MQKHQRVWLKRWIRVGYATKGLLYVIMGSLALWAALEQNVDTPDLKSSLYAIADQPLGEGLLVSVAVGLVGYAVWRFIQAIIDPEHDQITAKIILRRIGSFISGFAYGILGLSAVQLVFQERLHSDGTNVRFWASYILDFPLGQWLVGACGGGVIGVGLSFMYRALKAHFKKHLKLRQVQAHAQTWIIAIGRLGLASRGIIFMVVGGYLIRAAYFFNPDQAQAPNEALRTIKYQPYGAWLLSAVALGLIAYGVHMGLQARYRRFDLA